MKHIKKFDEFQQIIQHSISELELHYWTACSNVLEHLYEKHGGIKIPNKYLELFIGKYKSLSDDGYHFSIEVPDADGEMVEIEKVIFGFNSKEAFEHIKITKHERLDDNYGVYTSYMYITGRIYNKDCSRYRSFKTIVDFCLDDMYCTALDDAYYAKYEDYDADIYSEFSEEFDRKYKITDKKINDYADELFYCSQGEYIESYNDCKKFYQICNASIDEYNNRFNRAA